LALGGAGIVFGEETAVEARGRKTYECAGIWNDRQVANYRRITDFIRSLGSVPAIQLGHCGRRAGTRGPMQGFVPLSEEDARLGCSPWVGLAPSPIPPAPGVPTPHEMDLDDIKTVVQAFKEAADRSLSAGFDICEVHGAHGYLIHQFLSPVTNRRTDGYGGDRAGRMRFALEVAEAVRKAWPASNPLFFRVSAVDGKGGRWSIEDTLDLSRSLTEYGVDVIDCSSGGITGDSDMPALSYSPGYQVGFAERIRRDVQTRTMAVGLLTDPHQVEEILRNGQADLIAMARELMYHGDWPVHAAKALGVPEHIDIFPADFAWRLKRRARGQGFTI
jgi:2,4-dienoyl-CoA reductase-like NADH-dependent reductase (Old Yellow Enzyme family)